MAEVATKSREIARGKQAVSYVCWTDSKTSSVLLAPICSRGDNTMYYLNLYPVDSAVHFVDSVSRRFNNLTVPFNWLHFHGY